MCALITLEDFIVKTNAHEVLTIIMQTLQVTQAISFPKVKHKIILDIGCDNLARNMATILSIHALHLQRPMCSQKHRWQFEKDISIKSN